jgi:hypothetical protein
MSKARKNRRGMDNICRKRVKRWFKRLLAAEIEGEEKRRKRELGLTSESSEISFSSYNSPIQENWRMFQPEGPHPFSSRAESPVLDDSDYYCSCDIKYPGDKR